MRDGIAATFTCFRVMELGQLASETGEASFVDRSGLLLDDLADSITPDVRALLLTKRIA